MVALSAEAVVSSGDGALQEEVGSKEGRGPAMPFLLSWRWAVLSADL